MAGLPTISGREAREAFLKDGWTFARHNILISGTSSRRGVKLTCSSLANARFRGFLRHGESPGVKI